VQDVLNIGVDPVCLRNLKGVSSPLVAVCLKTPFEGQWFTGWRDSGSRAEFQNGFCLMRWGIFLRWKAAAVGKSQMAFAW